MTDHAIAQEAMTSHTQDADADALKEAQLFCLEIDDDLPLADNIAKLIQRLKSRQPHVPLTEDERDALSQHVSYNTSNRHHPHYDCSICGACADYQDKLVHDKCCPLTIIDRLAGDS